MTQKTVIRPYLYEAVYKKTGLSHAESAKLVKLILQEITSCLERGESVRLSSFGSFIVRNKRERMGRNPNTGQAVPISARRVLVFKPSKVLKQRINAASSSSETGKLDSDSSDRPAAEQQH